MYNLLIVDDEQLERDGLYSMIDWSNFKISDIMTAKNGFDALRKAEKMKPDILITDVKMPGMTGLELVVKLKDKIENLKVIFTSGYDDADFMRNALRLNAYEYILKPVVKQELIDAVQRICNDMDKEKRIHSEKESLLSIADQSRELFQEKLLDDIIYGTLQRKKLTDIEEKFLYALHENASFTTLLVELDDYSGSKSESSPIKMHQIIRSLSNHVLINPNNCKMIIKAINDKRFLIVICAAYNLGEDEIERTSNEMLQYLKNDLQISVTIAVGLVVPSIEETCQSYDFNCELIHRKMFVGKGIVLTKKNTPLSEQNASFADVFASVDSELIKCVRNYDVEKLNHHIDRLFDTLETSGVFDQTFVQNICINVISKLQLYVNEVNETVENIFGIGTSLWNKLIAFETIIDIRQWMKGVFKAVIEYFSLKENSNCRKIVSKVVEEMEKHYNEELVLKDIAAKMYYSPNHLGYIFKQETGKGFNDYLTEIRMKKACGLLEDPTLKIYEIAAMVAYQNSNAFSIKFKEYYGVTPKKYRENLKV